MRYLCFIASILITGTYTLISHAQPAVSRGEQQLAISFQEAMNRSEAALKAEGYVNIYKSDNMVGGYKGEVSAIIINNIAPNGNFWINVFTASLTNNSGIPGGERVRLQARMGNPAGERMNAGFSGNWEGGSDWGIISIQQNGSQITGRYTISGGGLAGRVDGNYLIFSWKNDNNPREGEAFLELKPNGNMEGKWCYGRGCNFNTGTSFRAIRQ